MSLKKKNFTNLRVKFKLPMHIIVAFWGSLPFFGHYVCVFFSFLIMENLKHRQN